MDVTNGNIDTKPKFIPIETLIHYADKGLSFSDIGKIVNCTKQAVSARFQAIEYTPERLQQYKSTRADVYAHYQSLLLNSLTPADVKKMQPAQRVMCFGILYDKERLERGQSTENVSIAGTLNSIDSRIQELRKRLPSK